MHKMAFAHVFGPEKKNGFGPFSYKFFVCIRVGLKAMFPRKYFDNFSPEGGCSERFRCVQIFLKPETKIHEEPGYNSVML